MGKERKVRKKNPTISVRVKCPGCNKKLVVSAFRTRTNPSAKAEYEVWTEIEIDEQQEFPGMEKPLTGTAETKKKKAAAKKKKKAPASKKSVVK